jgi:iron complex outermembrane recepter protein
VRTKAPTYTWQGDAQASYGNRDAFRLMGAVGGPLVEERVAVRVSGVMNRRDGHLDDVATQRDVNDRDRYAVRGQLRLDPSSDVSLRVIADYAEKNEACCAATVVVNGTRAPIVAALGGFVPTVFNDYTVANNRPFEADTREWGLSGQAEVRLGATNWSTVLSYRDFTSSRTADSDFTNLDLVNTPFEDTEDRFLTAETTLKGRTGPVDWLVGGFYFDQRTEQASAITYGADLGRFFQRVFPAQAALLANLYPVGGGDTQRNFRQEASGWSVFTHNIVELLPGLKATVGLRYLEEDKDGAGRFLFNSPSCGRAGVPAGAQQLCPTPNFDSRFSDNKLVGTGGLSWEPSPTSLIYASYSHGYKAGGLNLDRTAGLAGAAGSTFLPEEVDSYEIGAKGRFLDGRVRLGLTLFTANVKNFQQNAFTGIAFAISNAAAVKTRGVEAEANIQPVRWLGLGTSLVYNEATYGPTTQDATLRGRQIVNAPKWTVQNQLNIATPEIGRWSGYFNANMRWLSDLNTSVSLIPQAEQDGYVLLGGRIGVKSSDERWDLSAYAQNLTNRYYRTLVFAGVIQPGTFNAYVGEPRSTGIELRVRF